MKSPSWPIGLAAILSTIASSFDLRSAPPQEGLFVWLKADVGVTTNAGGVTEWRDQTAAGHRFTPAPNSQPSLSPPEAGTPASISFDGSDRLLGSLGGVLNEATIFSVMRYTIADSNNDYLYSIGVEGPGGSQMSLSRRSGRRAYHYDGSSAHLAAAESFPSQQWLVTEQIFGGPSPRQHQLYIESRSVLRTQAGGPYAADAATFVIGDWSGPGYQFIGDLAELIVYTRALTEAERREVTAYLRARVSLPPTFADEAEVLSQWEVVQYELDAQPDAQWIFDLGGTRADQPVNSDPSILLSDIDVTNKVVWGQIGSGTAPDSMGFVFGYRDRGHFYLFDWKKETADYLDFGELKAGMKLRAFHIPEGDPNGRDFWSSPDPNRVTVLRTNSLPWATGNDYRFTLRFVPGDFTLRIWDGDQVIEDWSVDDQQYANGRFGYFVNSLQNVRFGEVLVGELEPLHIVQFNRSAPASALRWLGGIPPYQIERRPQLETGGWQRDPTFHWLRSTSVTDPGDVMFYEMFSLGDP